MESSADNMTIKIPLEAGHIGSVKIERAHGLQKNLIKAALLAATALASVHAGQVPDAAAGSFSTVIQVNAVVLARTQLTALLQPATLVVTEANVQQGYVEISGASLYEIWNNDPAGCILTFAPSNFPFREAAVTVMGREINIYPMGGMIVIPILGRQQIALNYRFFLTTDAEPGTYAWPLSVSVNPR